MTNDGNVEVTCPNCDATFAGYAFASPSHCTITLDDHKETEVNAEEPYYSPPEDYDYETPGNPYSIFLVSYNEATGLLYEKGDGETDLIRRMVFAHYIGALEAYLGDTLINAVMADDKALAALLEKDADLKKDRFSLAEIFGTPDLVKNKVRARLRSLMWHNIGKVNALYRNALDVDIMKMLGKGHLVLLQAIEYRHDCVHRNGYDKDSNKLTVFTQEYVQSTGELISNLVLAIQEALAPPEGTDF